LLGQFEVAYFTASCDAEDVNREFAESLKLEYPILSDPEKSVATAYGVVHEGRALPERWTYFIGIDGKILAIDKKVNPATHGKDCAERLRELKVANRNE